MARIRTIKPGFFKSEDVSTLPMRARLTWIGLWTQCDDHGRYKDSARLLKGDLWSLEDVSLADIEEDLGALADAKRIVRYEVDGRRYLVIVQWHKHQAINRPSKAVHPAPPFPMASADPNDPNHCKQCALPGSAGRLAPAEQYASEPRETVNNEVSVTAHGTLTEHSRQEGKGKEGKGREGTRAREDEPSPPNNPSPEPPPPRCPDHIDNPTDDPCGGCGRARKALEAWEVEQAQRERHAAALAKSRTARERAELAAREIRACQRCDHLGRLPDQRVCGHQPDAAPGAAAAARANIRPAPAGRQRVDPVALARQRDPESPLDQALAEVIPIRPAPEEP